MAKTALDCLCRKSRGWRHEYSGCLCHGTLYWMSEYSEIAQARLADLMELQGKLMPPATHLAKAENQAGAIQSIKTIRNFFNTSQWKTVIIKDSDRPIGYITADALLRAQYRTQDAAILV
jgi:hypothetical protein